MKKHNEVYMKLLQSDISNSLRIMASAPAIQYTCSLGKLKLRFIMAIQNKKWEKALALASTRMNEFDALCLAISNNAESLVECLIDMGWKVGEVRRKDGASPVHAAVGLRNYSMIKMLIQRGAAVAHRDNFHMTPLMKCMKGKLDNLGRNIYQLLVENMTPEEFRGESIYGDSLLHIMARNHTTTIEMYELIMYKGVDVNHKDNFVGRSFLSEMMMHIDDEGLIIKVGTLACKHGFNLNAIDNFGSTIVHRIVVEQKVKVLRWLLSEVRVPIRVGNVSGQTPMYWAVQRGNKDLIDILYRIGESFIGMASEFPGRGRRTLHQTACFLGHKGVATMIDKELKGELAEGKRVVKPLRKIAKEAIREVLASGGMDISREVYGLGLPKTLGTYLTSLEWE